MAAATVNAAKAMLKRIGLTDDAAREVVADTGQGLSTIEDFAQMDKDDIQAMFKLMSRHGGAGAGIGVKVSAVAQSNFKDMCYLLSHRLNRIDRTTIHTDVQLAIVKKMKFQRQQEQGHVNPTVPPKLDTKNWPKTMESLEIYIKGHRAGEKGPLSYVVRKELFPPAAAVDPGFGDIGTKYNNHDDEMIARQRIIDASVATMDLKVHEKNGPFTDNFTRDRATVYDLLSALFNNTDAYAVIKPYKTKSDGRGAWLALTNHYLGEDNVGHMAGMAEKQLSTISYKGEGRNWNFDKFAITQMEAHTILKSLEDHGYQGIDERSKVRHLMNGIKTKSLDAVKTRIMSDVSLKSDFDGCVTLFKEFIRSDDYQDVSIQRNISAVEGNPGQSINPKDDRFIPPDEWREMTDDQKEKHKQARAARRALQKKQKGKGGGTDDHTSGGGGDANKRKRRKSNISKMVNKIVKRRIAALKTGKEDDDDSNAETLEDMKSKDGHSMRQKSAKKGKVGGK